MVSGPRPSGQVRASVSVAPYLLVNVLRACLSALVAIPLALGSVAVTVAQDDAVEPLPERILFIGNSHTERYGGLDWLVGNMVAAERTPRPYAAARRTSSGVTLEYHFNNGAPDAIRSGDYDVVVLQGHLPGAAVPSTAPFLQFATKLHSRVVLAGADTVLFMTWPQGKHDWATLDDFVVAHRELEARLGVPVAPVGVAFANARVERPELVLIGDDTIHATWAGAYLAAATVYATLFDRSPEGLPFTFGVSEEDAAFLQRIAWQTLTDWRAGIPAAG